ncbi:MAG: glycine--tRNA ligase subunit beta, partial [Deltaproteobacteria bacterium]|nr:glycine--tRNA ligase subunit beta [Deltaproteobacteria bacterium]
INAIPFPKSMRWGDLSLTFARPIHAIVALLDDKVISFKLEATKSGRRTLGHRFMHPKRLSIANASEYLSVLQPAHVVADIAERKAMIEDQIARAADSLGGKILPDNELLETVTNLVEYVCVSAGRFDKSFLTVPSEVLITAMREHQKYFAVIDSRDKLLPCFVAVNNTLAEDMAVVTTGHERVLRARLEDARFFFEADTKAPFPKMVERLKGVTFQAKLGSMFDKVCRVQKMAEHLALLAAPDLETTLLRLPFLGQHGFARQTLQVKW